MLALRLWHFMAVSFVVMAIIGLSIKHLLLEDNKWQHTSGQGLYLKMQTGLAQIYWQWQQAGRPKRIDYKPENVDVISQIVLDKQGRPQFAESEQGCKQMLSWFVDKKTLNFQVDVSTTINTDGIEPASSFSCKFEYADYVYLYNTSTRQLDFYDAE